MQLPEAWQDIPAVRHGRVFALDANRGCVEAGRTASDGGSKRWPGDTPASTCAQESGVGIFACGQRDAKQRSARAGASSS